MVDDRLVSGVRCDVARIARLMPSISLGFALIYDSRESMNFEPKHRLVRKGLSAKVEKPSRKLRKERKNRAKSEYIRRGRPLYNFCCD